jgi:predicted DNA-binding antitoxin AbrB/MazE fold protein
MMVGKTVEAVFDGTVLHLKEPLELKKGARVRIAIEAIELEPIAPTKPCSFLQTARSLQLQGPTDWSTNIQHYLYGDGEGVKSYD